MRKISKKRYLIRQILQHIRKIQPVGIFFALTSVCSCNRENDPFGNVDRMVPNTLIILCGHQQIQRAAAGFAASLRQQPVPPHRFLNEPRETALERRAANLLRDLRPPEQENGRIVRSFFARIFRNGA